MNILGDTIILQFSYHMTSAVYLTAKTLTDGNKDFQ